MKFNHYFFFLILLLITACNKDNKEKTKEEKIEFGYTNLAFS